MNRGRPNTSGNAIRGRPSINRGRLEENRNRPNVNGGKPTLPAQVAGPPQWIAMANEEIERNFRETVEPQGGRAGSSQGAQWSDIGSDSSGRDLEPQQPALNGSGAMVAYDPEVAQAAVERQSANAAQNGDSAVNVNAGGGGDEVAAQDGEVERVGGAILLPDVEYADEA
ncbi:hypothetical protein Slin14017_G063240 [Septoria linicola]|nr:hypothetical protein Slin14017_G063240 [Septoria linicola]